MDGKSLAVITARGGSKRIPRKNIRQFCGKPIIQYSIEAAVTSGIFDEVMVSTDDEEIKTIAERYGGKVPFLRSGRNASDMAATHEVLLEVLEEYRKREQKFEYICCIYPTAPFITANRLRQSKEKLEKTGADGIVPVVSFSFPPQRCFVIKNGKIKFKWPENQLTRSQDLEKWYHDCGQFYFLRVDAFVKQKKMILENMIPIIIDEMEMQDIDTYDDWKMAEIKYQILKNNCGGMKE